MKCHKISSTRCNRKNTLMLIGRDKCRSLVSSQHTFSSRHSLTKRILLMISSLQNRLPKSIMIIRSMLTKITTRKSNLKGRAWKTTSSSKKKSKSIRASSKATDSPSLLRSKKLNRPLSMMIMISTAKSYLKRRSLMRRRCILRSSSTLLRLELILKSKSNKSSVINNQSKKPSTRTKMSKPSREHTSQASAPSLKRAHYRTIWCSRLSHTRLIRQVSLFRLTLKNLRHRIRRWLRRVDILLRALIRVPMNPARCKRAHSARPSRTLRLKKMWARSFIRPTFKSLFKRLMKVISRILTKNCQLLMYLLLMGSATAKSNTFANLLTRSGRSMIQTTVVRLIRLKLRTS